MEKLRACQIAWILRAAWHRPEWTTSIHIYSGRCRRPRRIIWLRRKWLKLSMANQIEQYFERLNEDEFRTVTPFSKDLEETEVGLLNSSSSEEAGGLLCSWLGSNPPCLFGRMPGTFGGC